MIPYGIEDKYLVIKTLHQSAAAAVLLVRHKQIGELRVLKVIQADQPESSQILSEANLLSGINSPGIPTIYDVVSTTDCVYLIEEYVEGISLQELIFEKAQIEKSKLLSIFIDLCKILEELHGARPDPIIYRDLKPEHIIIQNDKVRLIDFGISIRKSECHLAASLGTLGYAAPEQLRGEPVDERSDIYSLGKIINEAFLTLVPEEDYKVKLIIEKATAEQVDQRASSVKVLREQLEAISNELTINNKGKKHLKKNIAVISASNACGATFISVALTQYLNKNKINAYYRDMTGCRTTEILTETLKGNRIKEGVLYHNDFAAIMDYGPAVEKYKPPEGIQIMDMGLTDKMPDADLTVFVVSASPWKEYKLPNWIKDKRVIVINNLSNKLSTIEMATSLKKPVYMYPMVSRGFLVSKDETKLFNVLMKKYHIQ